MPTPDELVMICLGNIEASVAGMRRAKRALVAWKRGDLQENEASNVILAAARECADAAAETALAARALENAIQPSLGLEPREE